MKDTFQQQIDKLQKSALDKQAEQINELITQLGYDVSTPRKIRKFKRKSTIVKHHERNRTRYIMVVDKQHYIVWSDAVDIVTNDNGSFSVVTSKPELIKQKS